MGNAGFNITSKSVLSRVQQSPLWHPRRTTPAGRGMAGICMQEEEALLVCLDCGIPVRTSKDMDRWRDHGQQQPRQTVPKFEMTFPSDTRGDTSHYVQSAMIEHEALPWCAALLLFAAGLHTATLLSGSSVSIEGHPST
jgi:hypothetical protein